jgi:hypothetical protein
MIWPSSPLGILLNWISFTATVSPVAQLSAPGRVSIQSGHGERGFQPRLTVNLGERALPQRITELLRVNFRWDVKNAMSERVDGTHIVIEDLGTGRRRYIGRG